MTVAALLAAINARLVDATEPVVMSDTIIVSYGGSAHIHASIINLGGVAHLRVSYDTHSRIVEPYTRLAVQADIDGYLGTV